MALFERDALTDGTQVTVPRYLQEGSTIVNIQENVVTNTNETLYTVSSGKVLYVTDVKVQTYIVGTPTNSDYGYLRDIYDLDNRLLIAGRYASGAFSEVLSYHFDTPLKIPAGLQWYSAFGSAQVTFAITISGWEEDA